MEPEPTSMRGQLLVAAPPLVDPNFDRTVVLMLEHGAEGALGIVLNRPSATPLDDVLPEWRPLASEPLLLFNGGPVAPDAIIALARTESGEREGFIPVLDGIGTVDVGLDPLDLGVPIDDLRIFAGYAGWAAHQLEAEIGQGGWFVVPATNADPFAPRPERLWRDVLRRQRGRIAMFAHSPADASTN